MWPFSTKAASQSGETSPAVQATDFDLLFAQERWLHSARSKERFVNCLGTCAALQLSLPRRYKVGQKLGEGAYATVFQCARGRDAKGFALKVTRGDPAYFASGSMEAQVLKQASRSHACTQGICHTTAAQIGAYHPESTHDISQGQSDTAGIVRCVDVFVLHGHVCVVLERLAETVYDVLKQRDFVGIPMTRIKDTARELLGGMAHLHGCGLSHNDIKPENLMFAKDGSCRLIDFGSATAHSSAVLSKPYAQSRFYRAPEVLLGCQYSPAVDIWSAGCLLAELWLGLPLFAGGNTWDQCRRVTALLGAPPFWMVQFGTQSHALFEVARNTGRRKGVLRMAHGSIHGWSGFCIKLRSEKTWLALSGGGASRDMSAWQQQYLSTTTLSRLLALHVPSELKKDQQCERAIPTGDRAAPLDPTEPHSVEMLLFCDFVAQMVHVDPLARASAQQLLRHPFLTGHASAQEQQTLVQNGKHLGIVKNGGEGVHNVKGHRRSLSGPQGLPSQRLLDWSPPPHKRWHDTVSSAQRATARCSEHAAMSISHRAPVFQQRGADGAAQVASEPVGSRRQPVRRASLGTGRSEGNLLTSECGPTQVSSLLPLQSYGFLPPSLLGDSGAPVPLVAAQRSMSWKGSMEQPASALSRPRHQSAQSPALARAGSETRLAYATAPRPRRSSLLAQPIAGRQSSEPHSRARRFSHNDLQMGLAPRHPASGGNICQASPPSPASSVDDDSASFCSIGYTSAPGTPMQTPFGLMHGMAVTGNGVSFLSDPFLGSLHIGEMAAGPADPWEALAASGDANEGREGQGSPGMVVLPVSRRRSSAGSMFSVGSRGNP